MVVDPAGAAWHLYTYDPFGTVLEHLAAPSAPANPFLFTGQWYDEEIGQYYLRARMYDSIIMRFTTRDPVTGGFKDPLTLHRYLYCLNDPVNHIDFSGQMADAVVRAKDAQRCAAGFFVAVVLGMYIDNYNTAVSYMAEGLEQGIDDAIGFGYATYEIGKSAIDYVFAASASKQAQKHFDGALNQVYEHLDKYNGYDPGDFNKDPRRKWIRDMAKHLRRMEKEAGRMGKKAEEEAIKKINELRAKIKPLADKYGVDWP